MKKTFIITVCAICAFFFASCGKSYKDFVGTWGVEKIQYYNIDYAGNPISSTIETLDYDPEDIDDGIQLIFRSNKTGEMHDNDVDSVTWIFEEDTVVIHCPDTTLITNFTYSYDKNQEILYMNMQYYDGVYTWMINVTELTSNSFVYENEYKAGYMEKAYMKRLSKSTSTSKSKSPYHKARPRKAGSLLESR